MLVYVFHYLHGACCLEVGDIGGAIRMAQTQLPRRRGEEVAQLWRLGDIVGWPKTLTGHCTTAWEFLLGLPNRHPVVDEFFAFRRDYENCLASYNALLTLMELGTDAAELRGMESLSEVQLEVPPMYATMAYDVREHVVRWVVADPGVVAAVAAAVDGQLGHMGEVWSNWANRTKRCVLGVTDHGIWPDQVDLGELATQS